MEKRGISPLDLTQVGMILAKVTNNTDLTWTQTFIPLYILTIAITIKTIYIGLKGGR